MKQTKPPEDARIKVLRDKCAEQYKAKVESAKAEADAQMRLEIAMLPDDALWAMFDQEDLRSYVEELIFCALERVVGGVR